MSVLKDKKLEYCLIGRDSCLEQQYHLNRLSKPSHLAWNEYKESVDAGKFADWARCFIDTMKVQNKDSQKFLLVFKWCYIQIIICSPQILKNKGVKMYGHSAHNSRNIQPISKTVRSKARNSHLYSYWQIGQKEQLSRRDESNDSLT